MQVYLLEHEGEIDHGSAFRNFQDIKPSLLLSYSACANLSIEAAGQPHGGPLFTVKGRRDNKDFVETFKVHRIPVWDSVTHL